MIRKPVILTPVLLLFISGYAFCQYNDTEFDVPFVPTNFPVVERMLEMAQIGKDDILYDLGCGDGRIVITAAKKYGTHGTGIDINPVRISECNENASKEGVTDSVNFMVGDLFEADIHDATVVTLYLLKSVNIRLRPRLFSELKPGTRIVSHDFDMGTWEPEQYEVIENAGDNIQSFRNHSVYFWIMPANFSGSWDMIIEDGVTKKSSTLLIDQKFQKISGSITSGGKELPLLDTHVESATLTLSVKERETIQTYTGTISGDTINGRVKTPKGDIIWIARRDPSTIKQIDDQNSEN